MLLSCPTLVIKNLVTFRVGNVYYLAKKKNLTSARLHVIKFLKNCLA